MGDDWAVRARSFGQVAELYDRWRPGYPDALFADVLALAPGGRVLEAGAGTGRATLELARRGATVLAVEPDAAMAAVVRARATGLAVRVHGSTFEECPAPAGEFDLVASAQAWHWVDPERGAAAAARALRPGGALCVWWNRPRDPTGPVWDAVHAAYAAHAPSLVGPDRLRQQPDRESAFPTAPGFTPWSIDHYDWATDHDPESYPGLIGTYSNHLGLPAAQRRALLAAVGEAITRVGGGRFRVEYRTVLAHARPVPRRG